MIPHKPYSDLSELMWSFRCVFTKDENVWWQLVHADICLSGERLVDYLTMYSYLLTSKSCNRFMKQLTYYAWNLYAAHLNYAIPQTFHKMTTMYCKDGRAWKINVWIKFFMIRCWKEGSDINIMSPRVKSTYRLFVCVSAFLYVYAV